jgi:hypothetical protein
VPIPDVYSRRECEGQKRNRLRPDRLEQGSFALAFLTIPVFMVAMAAGVWFTVPEHAGKELNAIAV